jgi:hypothetical protein
MFKYLLTILSALLTGNCATKVAEPEIHFIPHTYYGQVSISFNQTNGKEPKYDEQKRRLYEINENGRLATQFAPNLGIRPPENFSFYHVKNNGEKILLPHANKPGNEPNTVVVGDVYIAGNSLYYVIDSLKNIGNYKNPTIDEQERQPSKQ